MTTATEIYWDPYDVELDTSPYEMWRRMRDDAPVYWNDTYRFFALTRFQDVEDAHKDPTTFCSRNGITLEMMSAGIGATTGSMIAQDPPYHTRLRHLVSRAFTPRRINDLEPKIRAICNDLMDEAVAKGAFDYVQDFGAKLPSRVISTLVGVPPEDQEEQRRVVDQLFHIEPGVGMVNDISATAGLNLITYLSELLAQREKDPKDDLATALMQAEVNDDDGVPRKLTREESANFALLLFTAGTETVARLLGNAAIVLADHPDQRAILAEDQATIPNGIEELLRYEAPSPVQGRWTTRDVELHGTTIPKDSMVLLLTGSAGRDEREFPDADRFDVMRKIDHHVSFGYGIHFCVGAALARMEGRIALEETLERFPEWEVDRDNAERLHTSTVRGWKNVPLVL